MDNLRYIFNLINTSGTNAITAEELLIFLNNIDPNITLADTEALITQNDTNGNGVLDFEEFVGVIGININDEDLIQAFQYITTNGQPDIALLTSYYNLLQIEPFYRHTNAESIDIIFRMIGSTEQEFIELWNFLNTRI